MIYITKTEETVMKVYNSLKNTTKTSQAVKKHNQCICRMLRHFVAIGLMEKQGRFYVPTGVPYKLVTSSEKMGNKIEREVEKVPMTEYERKWMLENYKPRKRSVAAKALGRTRSDICLMAIELKIDVEGRWVKNAKTHQNRSA